MKTYLTYGFAMALAGALLVLALFFLGFHSAPEKIGTAQLIGTVGNIAIAVACIVLGTKARRDEVPATEPFGYGRALGAGVMISVFAGLFGILTTWLYFQVINPEMNELIVQSEIAKLEAKGMGSAEIETAESVMRKMMNPVLQSIFALIGTVFFGFIVSLITSAFLKRPATTEPPALA